MRLPRRLSRAECPCCGWSGLRFRDLHGNPARLCPDCGSYERHRQLALLFDQRPQMLAGGQRVLHLAPERALRLLVEKSKPSRYVTADMEAEGVDMHFDLTAAPLGDGEFDVILCNHIMEHVPDDRAAMREIRRMLADGGWATMMTPIVVETTDEEPDIDDPEEQLRRFGQADHVRRYGWDYVDRLRAEGLETEVIRQETQFDADRIERYRLLNLAGEVEPIFLVRPG